jgi:peptidoglycan/LPS O-acetylase OafA/YrhL
MLVFTVFGLGLFFTSLSASSYLADSKTHIYLATLGLAASYSLPGVFDGNPYKSAVNGALWTLRYEIMMYAILAIVWAALRIIKRNRFRIFEFAIVTSAAVAGFLVVALHFHSSAGGPFIKLFFMFMSGATFYVLKEQIMFSRWLFWLFAFSLLLSAFVNKHAFFVIYVLTIPYVLFTFAYIPSGWIRKYNQVGDCSYGVYIYAFPIQQSVAALVPGVSVLSMLLTSAFVTLVLAVLSWHLIEQRVLLLRERYVGHTRKILTLTEVL